MCGIVAYVGKKDVLPVLLDGLKVLEYRGYDSAGVAVLEAGRLIRRRQLGKIIALEQSLKEEKEIKGTAGIAHTRWATHGGVTEANAHPHFDCSGNLALVHNGIIENYKEIKKDLLVRGHKFTSETDTEVLVHLIEDFLNKGESSLEAAVRAALNLVRGTYGIAVVSATEPQKIVAARNFSPLVLGVGNGEYLVASDASPILRHTREVIYLHDGEMAVVTDAGHRIFDLQNRLVERPSQQIDWSIEEAEKGGYAHFMLKEIFEQPESLGSSIRGRLLAEEGRARLGGLNSIRNKLKDVKKIIISGCGTAYLAGKVGEYMLEEYVGLPVRIELASELRYRKPVFEAGDMLVVLSQSGETADTLAALREAKQKGILTLGIVNVVGSSIARDTEAGIYQHIGPEIGVASTKAFTSQVAIMALLTLLLARERQMSLPGGEYIVKEIKKLPQLAEKTLAVAPLMKALADKYRDVKNFFYLGRKYNLPTALEGALKLKEIAYVHAEGYGAGELKHGPLALIDNNLLSVFVAPTDSIYDKTVSNMQEVKARGGRILAIATEGNEEIGELADDVVYIPRVLEMLSPAIAVIPLQLFAYYFGLAHGRDVDKPRNLAKSVTVE